MAGCDAVRGRGCKRGKWEGWVEGRGDRGIENTHAWLRVT